MRLLRILKSERANKKYVAVFDEGNGRIKQTYFGAPGYKDFTTHHDPQRREQYRKRHEKDLDTNDPTRAGFLSYYLLWGDSTNLQVNIDAYRKKFKL